MLFILHAVPVAFGADSELVRNLRSNGIRYIKHDKREEDNAMHDPVMSQDILPASDQVGQQINMIVN